MSTPASPVIQQPDPSDLDVVQHPTLGTLKFPKSMPFDQRNSMISDMENERDLRNATPTEFEQQNQSSPAGGVAREAALGALTGATGLPETQHPVMDFIKSLGSKRNAPSTLEKFDPTGGALTSAIKQGKGLYNTAKELFTGKQGSPEEEAHLAGSALGQVAPFALGGAPERAAVDSAFEKVPLPGDIADAIASKANKVADFAQHPIDAVTSNPAELHQRAVAPTNVTATQRQVISDEFKRAEPYLVDEMKNRPTKESLTGEKMGGAIRGGDRVDLAAGRVWDNQIQPEINNAGPFVIDGAPIAAKIRDSVSNVDQATSPAAVSQADDIANYFDRKMKVQDLSDEVRDLNDDKSLQNYEKARAKDPDTPTDLRLEVKLAARDAAREHLLDSVSNIRGEAAGSAFAEARKDWGALHSIAQRYRTARTPMPESVLARLGNSVRGIVSKAGPHAYVSAGTDTLLGRDNPDVIIPKLLNKLGRSESPRALPPEVQAVSTTAPIALPPIGGTGRGNAPPAALPPYVEPPPNTGTALARVPGSTPTTHVQGVPPRPIEQPQLNARNPNSPLVTPTPEHGIPEELNFLMGNPTSTPNIPAPLRDLQGPTEINMSPDRRVSSGSSPTGIERRGADDQYIGHRAALRDATQGYQDPQMMGDPTPTGDAYRKTWEKVDSQRRQATHEVYDPQGNLIGHVISNKFTPLRFK